ncbi:MAG: mechanosensitive ion channel family protein, partial [Calditrichaeota bacterium]
MDLKNISQEFVSWFAGIGFKLAIIIGLTIVALIIVRMITKRFVKIYVDKHAKDVEMQKRAETLGKMFNYFLVLTVFSVSLMLVLDLFGVKLGPLLAAAGVVGVAIGFGTQHLVQDLLNGFFIMLDDEIREG